MKTSQERPKSVPRSRFKIVKVFLHLQKNTIIDISSVLQYQKMHEGICKRLENWKQQKTYLVLQKTSKNEKLRSKNSKYLSENVSGMSHSAENLKLKYTQKQRWTPKPYWLHRNALDSNVNVVH